MVYRGHVQNGVIVVDDPVTLPEGLKVAIELLSGGAENSPPDDNDLSLGQKLLKYAGKATGLPPDAAYNHDHYLYGTPKK